MSADAGLPAPRWHELANRLGLSGSDGLLAHLEAAYGESHRHYHTGRHVSECLEAFDRSGRDARHPDEVEYAIWLHDVVYSSFRGGSETRSADRAVAWARDSALSADALARIRSLILRTDHQTEPATPDEALMLDVDLNILGASPARYAEYETQVRKEYRWVPGPLFRSRRAALLEAFLDRPTVFWTPWFVGHLEERARDNVQRAVKALREGTGLGAFVLAGLLAFAGPTQRAAAQNPISIEAYGGRVYTTPEEWGGLNGYSFAIQPTVGAGIRVGHGRHGGGGPQLLRVCGFAGCTEGPFAQRFEVTWWSLGLARTVGPAIVLSLDGSRIGQRHVLTHEQTDETTRRSDITDYGVGVGATVALPIYLLGGQARLAGRADRVFARDCPADGACFGSRMVYWVGVGLAWQRQ